jgi:hypothetical protein
VVSFLVTLLELEELGFQLLFLLAHRFYFLYTYFV